MADKIKGGYIFDILISTILSMVLTMVAIVIFSLALNFFDINGELVYPINQAIKLFGVFFGVLFGVHNKKAGLVKGVVSGILAILLLFLIFSGLGGSVVFTKYTYIDIACGAVVGGIAGVFAVNIKKEKNTAKIA